MSKIFENAGEVRQLRAKGEKYTIVVEGVRRLQRSTTQTIACQQLILAVHHRNGIIGERRNRVLVECDVVLQELLHHGVVLCTHTSSFLGLKDSDEAVGLCR